MLVSDTQSPYPVIACLGEVLIDFIAEETGSLDKVSCFRKYPGGAPANVAVGIARLGVRCGFIGKVSTDIFGDFLISTLNKNHVDIGGITRTDDAPTALAFVSRTTTRDRDFLFYRESCADILLKKSELPQHWLDQIQYLHLGGVSLTREPSRQTTLLAAKRVKDNQASVSFDPNLRLDLWDGDLVECQSVVQSVLAYTDIFLPSHDELLMIMGTKDVNHALMQAHNLGPSVICVKQGPNGSLISKMLEDGKLHQFNQSAFDVKVVDTTGAGDGFDAGLLVGLINGLTLEEAVRIGTAVASLVISKIGAMTALPTEKELNAFLKVSRLNKF